MQDSSCVCDLICECRSTNESTCSTRHRLVGDYFAEHRCQAAEDLEAIQLQLVEAALIPGLRRRLAEAAAAEDLEAIQLVEAAKLSAVPRRRLAVAAAGCGPMVAVPMVPPVAVATAAARLGICEEWGSADPWTGGLDSKPSVELALMWSLREAETCRSG